MGGSRPCPVTPHAAAPGLSVKDLPYACRVPPWGLECPWADGLWGLAVPGKLGHASRSPALQAPHCSVSPPAPHLKSFARGHQARLSLLRVVSPCCWKFPSLTRDTPGLPLFMLESILAALAPPGLWGPGARLPQPWAAGSRWAPLVARRE